MADYTARVNLNLKVIDFVQFGGQVYSTGKAKAVLTPQMLRDVYGVNAQVYFVDADVPQIIPTTFGAAPLKPSVLINSLFSVHEIGTNKHELYSFVKNRAYSRINSRVERMGFETRLGLDIASILHLGKIH